MVAAMGCALEPREAVYVSTPITTGRRFLEWARQKDGTLQPGSDEYRREHLEHVVRPNREHVAPLVRDLRKLCDAVVIDPTSLEDVPGWQQFDYHGFWAEVIRRYVRTVVVVDGWQYSSGCAYELATALEAGIEVQDETLTPIDLDAAIRQVREAIHDLEEAGLETGALDEALRGLARAAESGSRG